MDRSGSISKLNKTTHNSVYNEGLGPATPKKAGSAQTRFCDTSSEQRSFTSKSPRPGGTPKPECSPKISMLSVGSMGSKMETRRASPRSGCAASPCSGFQKSKGSPYLKHLESKKCKGSRSMGEIDTLSFLATSPHFSNVLFSCCDVNPVNHHLNQYIDHVRRNNFPASYSFSRHHWTPPPSRISNHPINQKTISYSKSNVEQRRPQFKPQFKPQSKPQPTFIVEKRNGQKSLDCAGYYLCQRHWEKPKRRCKYPEDAPKLPYSVRIPPKEPPPTQPVSNKESLCEVIPGTPSAPDIPGRKSTSDFQRRVTILSPKDELYAANQEMGNLKKGKSYTRKFAAFSNKKSDWLLVIKMLQNTLFKNHA